MKSYLKYIPFLIGLILVFFAGRCTSPKIDKDLVRKYELERKTLLNDVSRLNGLIAGRTKQDSIIIKKMKDRHVRDSIALKANNEAYVKLIKQNEKINYRSASISKLDSARASYLTLYSN